MSKGELITGLDRGTKELGNNQVLYRWVKLTYCGELLQKVVHVLIPHAIISQNGR